MGPEESQRQRSCELEQHWDTPWDTDRVRAGHWTSWECWGVRSMLVSACWGCCAASPR